MRCAIALALCLAAAGSASSVPACAAVSGEHAERLKTVEARLAELTQKRGEFEERPAYHGWVWLYLRQAESAKAAFSRPPATI